MFCVAVEIVNFYGFLAEHLFISAIFSSFGEYPLGLWRRCSFMKDIVQKYSIRRYSEIEWPDEPPYSTMLHFFLSASVKNNGIGMLSAV